MLLCAPCLNFSRLISISETFDMGCGFFTSLSIYIQGAVMNCTDPSCLRIICKDGPHMLPCVDINCALIDYGLLISLLKALGIFWVLDSVFCDSYLCHIKVWRCCIPWIEHTIKQILIQYEGSASPIVLKYICVYILIVHSII